jgi:hypothetical protein
MKISIPLLLVGGLLSGALATGAEPTGPAAEPSAQPAPGDGAAAEAAQPAMTREEVEAALLEAAKKEAESGQQRAAGADGVDFRPWAPPPAASGAPKKTAHHAGSQFHAVSVTASGNQLYSTQWGIDSLKVAYTSSGNLLRFTYRVVDPGRAAPLADKKLTPSLYSPKHHAVLSVPVMEKVGPLRQAMEQKAGMEYWMAFSNRGALVKPGERVNITIGSFHADGLRVE